MNKDISFGIFYEQHAYRLSPTLQNPSLRALAKQSSGLDPIDGIEQHQSGSAVKATGLLRRYTPRKDGRVSKPDGHKALGPTSSRAKGPTYIKKQSGGAFRYT